MDATVCVELEAEDAYLEIPWHAGVLRYYDLKRHPELLLELPESHNREMAEFLTAMNSALSMVETAKCDAWLSNQMEEQEALYATSWKFGSYVDLIFTNPKATWGSPVMRTLPSVAPPCCGAHRMPLPPPNSSSGAAATLTARPAAKRSPVAVPIPLKGFISRSISSATVMMRTKPGGAGASR